LSCYKNGAVIGKWNSARTHSETQPRAPRVLVRFADSWKCFLGVQNVAVCRFSLAWVLCWSARAGGGSRSRLPCCVCVWFACAEFHVVCVFVRSAHFSLQKLPIVSLSCSSPCITTSRPVHQHRLGNDSWGSKRLHWV